MNGEPQLAGQTVVILGGSSGIGLETARRARMDGADLILAARDPEPLYRAGLELGAKIAVLDVGDFGRLSGFFAELRASVDHLFVTTGGPSYVPFADLDEASIRQGVEPIVVSVEIALAAKDAFRSAGSLTLTGGTEGLPANGPLLSAVTLAMPALTRNLALELAPVRVNLIVSGLVETSLSAGDVAALAIDLMSNSTETGATFDAVGGQQSSTSNALGCDSVS